MLFISAEDFISRASKLPRMTREEEKRCAQSILQGDTEARERLVQSYLPLVAAHVRRAPKSIQTLKTVYCCIVALEKGVDSFNFLQDGEPFSHHLSWSMRQCITRCIAER